MSVKAGQAQSTKEVAETVAATLEEQGLEVEVKPACEVRSLDGYGAVVLGTPLYMGALHRDVRALLEKNRAALERTPFALFALGPIKADDGVDGSRAQLIEALAKLPVPTPFATAVFVGAYGPARLNFKDKMIAALPASPLHGESAHDERDWEAIRRWAGELTAELRWAVLALR
ncbi:MAG: flavodoxin domain-containing protein [Thermoleophilia bacterium]